MKVFMGEFPNDNSERKISIEIDNFDTWNLDNTLAKIIFPTLEQLRDTTHGYPSELESGDDYSGAEKWTFILNEMIFAMKCISNEHWDDKYFNSKGKLLDAEGLKKDNERIQRGCELFGKYFRDLWD